MLRLSKKTVYALEAVVDIAYHGGAEPVQSRDITRRQEIPQRYLEQVMQHLVHAGVLKGVRGPRGGYRLARERRRISVADVARVVYDLEVGDNIIERETPSEIADKVVRPIWRDLRDQMMAQLQKITLEDLCQAAKKQGIASQLEEFADFNI